MRQPGEKSMKTGERKRVSTKPQKQEISSKLQLSTAQTMRLVLASFILVVLLLQLFTFEKFPGLLIGVGFDQVIATISSILLVLVELFALPFLIGLNLPAVWRKVSAVSVVATMLGWGVLEVMAFGRGASVIFGATFELPGGSWSLTFISAIWLLAVLASGLIDNTMNKKRLNEESR